MPYLVSSSLFYSFCKVISSQIQNELSSVNRRLGLTVKFLHEPPKRGTGEIYRTAREIIEKAENEILILYYSRSKYELQREKSENIAETDEYRAEREKYTRAIFEKLQQNKSKRLFYKRVVQLPEGRNTILTEDRLGVRWTNHFRGVLDILNDYPEAGYIKNSPLFLEQTFVIVDRRYVMWGLDALDPEHTVRDMEGALFFDDPHQEFIQYLIGFFERADAHVTIVRKIPEA